MEGGEKDAGEEAEVRYKEFIIGSLGIGKRSAWVSAHPPRLAHCFCTNSLPCVTHLKVQ